MNLQQIITYLLLFNQALHIPTMEHHLLNPNQMRAAGEMVNETPLIHLPMEARQTSSHSIMCPKQLQILLLLNGVISYFDTRKPTQVKWDEIDPSFCLEMMTDQPLWDLNDSTLMVDEQQLCNDIAQDKV